MRGWRDRTRRGSAGSGFHDGATLGGRGGDLLPHARGEIPAVKVAEDAVGSAPKDVHAAVVDDGGVEAPGLHGGGAGDLPGAVVDREDPQRVAELPARVAAAEENKPAARGVADARVAVEFWGVIVALEFVE